MLVEAGAQECAFFGISPGSRTYRHHIAVLIYVATFFDRASYPSSARIVHLDEEPCYFLTSGNCTPQRTVVFRMVGRKKSL